jgi:hypothetical protein
MTRGSSGKYRRRGSAPSLWMIRDGALRCVAWAYAPGMDPTVTGALIGAGGAVIVAVAGFLANVKNTSVTTAVSKQAVEVSQKAVEVSQKAVEAAQRTVEITEQGQVTARYAKAVEQLGSEKLDVRMGGSMPWNGWPAIHAGIIRR